CHFSILETAKELEQETVNALTTIETAQRLRPTGEARRLLLQLYILRITLAEDTQDEPIKRLYRTMALNRFHDPAQRARIIGRGTIRFGDRARGARVTLFTILPDKRGVLLPQKPRSLGTTPLGDASLPQGSYLLRFEKTGHTPTLFPVLVRRNLTQVVDPYVFPAEAIPRGYVYVPGGISMLGNPSDTLGETAWTWSFAKVEGFFIRRYPFTFAELTRFIAQRPEGKRQLHSSFYRGKPVLRYEEGKGGILNIQGTDFPEGTTVKGQDWRRVAFGLLDYRTATEVVAWEGNSLGLECAQIPSKEEYQRAARGADGRTYPWGNVWVKKAGAAIEGRQQFPMPTPPGTHKLDTSPFGVSDLSGNVSSWTRSSYKSAFGEAPDYRLVAGGAYSQFPIPTYYFQWFDLSEAADEVSVRPVISLKCFFQSQKKTGP
ncbi:formylglycine-generating enzyme family protein, partial [Myxococcota bacterium]|nr:formylglycine-generating enzyme family protein [Myxococcota bacterium]